MRSALEWARVRALAADGLSQREIARRLAINRRTVARLAASEEPPRYRRAPAGSQLDRFEPVLRRLLEEWPQIKAPRATELSRADYGYSGSVDLVRRRLRELRPRTVRPAQRTGYRPGQVQQLGWTELPTRPRVAGRERRVYALVASLPYSGAQTAFFSFDMTIESFLEGPRAGVRVGVPRECVYDNLRSVVARREGDEVVWNRRFLHLRGHYAFHATACTPAAPARNADAERFIRDAHGMPRLACDRRPPPARAGPAHLHPALQPRTPAPRTRSSRSKRHSSYHRPAAMSSAATASAASCTSTSEPRHE